MTTISSSTTLTTAYQVTGDTTGTLVFQTGSTPTTALTIGANQVVTFAQPPVGVDAFPSGTTMLFVQTAAPTGWTKSTTHDNKALRVVSGTAGTGGSVAFTTAFASQTPAGTVSVSGTVGATTLSTSQIPAHNHAAAFTEPISGLTLYPLVSALNVATGNVVNTNVTSQNLGTSAYYAQTLKTPSLTNTGGGGSHDHSFSGSGSFSGSAINLAVQYVDVIIATKN